MASPAFAARSDSESELEDYDLDLTHPLIRVLSQQRDREEHWISKSFRTIYNSIPLPVTKRAITGRHRRARSPLRLRPHGLRHLAVEGLRYLFLLACLFLLASLVNAILWPSYMSPPQHYQNLETKIQTLSTPGRGNPNNEKIYIAANIIHEDLIKQRWGNSLLELIDILGPGNVFVSIYENDSGKGTRDALLDLQKRLPCNSSVVAGDHLPLDGFPKVQLPSGSNRVKRITYLAEVRNRLLLPLELPARTVQWKEKHPTFHSATGSFDRVLFLNDIYFSPSDAAQLLFSTNQHPTTGRAQYTAACAADFVSRLAILPLFYDSFVVRDTEGSRIGFLVYPWFNPGGSAESRNAVLAEKDAVPVRSCWGGMAAFDASIFLPKEVTVHRNEGSSNTTLPAIRFRSSPEPFWEEAECCLVFADNEVRRASPGGGSSQHPGSFVNPFIRVAYDQTTWDWLPTYRRYERLFQFTNYWVSRLGNEPSYNPRRDHSPGSPVTDKVWVPSNDAATSGGKWEMMTRISPAGGWCGQRKMFVMKEDLEKANYKGRGRNWEGIPQPRG